MSRASRPLVVLITLCAVLLFVGPVIWLAVASLSTNLQIDTDPLGVGGLHFENYVNAWTGAHIGDYVINSLFVSGSTAIVVAVVGTMAGYALGCISFVGRRLVTGILLVALAAPVISYVVSLSQLAVTFGLLDSRLSVVLVNAATFSIIPTLMIANFFRKIPKELAEAARMDGASELRTFVDVMMPLARPAVLVALTFAFVWAWNDLLIPVVLLLSPQNYTIPQGIVGLRQNAYTPDFAQMFAGAVISAVPMVIVYRQLERRSLEALAAGAVAG